MICPPILAAGISKRLLHNLIGTAEGHDFSRADAKAKLAGLQPLRYVVGPQRLKPPPSSQAFGTVETVPFQYLKTGYATASSMLRPFGNRQSHNDERMVCRGNPLPFEFRNMRADLAGIAPGITRYQDPARLEVHGRAVELQRQLLAHPQRLHPTSRNPQREAWDR